MRAFKFRAYHKQHKKMYDVFSFTTGYIKIIVGIGTANELPAYDFKPLMQFSGLEDKNGKQCFEGDILDNFEEVFFKDGAFMTSIGALAISIEHREIIGNIYQNPELIKY